MGVFLDIQHAQGALCTGDDAVVSSLTAHLSVERGLIQNDQNVFLGLLIGSDGVGQGLLVAQATTTASPHRVS